MSNTNHLVARQMDRNRQQLQARLEKQRLQCRCGGTKDSAKMIVCLACFQSAPLAMQRDAYSRVPEVARTAMRQLLSRAESRKAERMLEPQRHRGHRENFSQGQATAHQRVAPADCISGSGPTESVGRAAPHFPGGEPTAACNPPQRLKALPAPAGASSTTEAARQRGPTMR